MPEPFFDRFGEQGIPVSQLYQCDAAGQVLPVTVYQNEFILLRLTPPCGKPNWVGFGGTGWCPLPTPRIRLWGQAPECGPVFYAGSSDEAGGRSSPGNYQGAGRYGQNLLFPGRGAGEAAGSPSGEYRRILICRPMPSLIRILGFFQGTNRKKFLP